MFDQSQWAEALGIYAAVVEEFGFPLCEGLRGEVVAAVAQDLDAGGPQMSGCGEETGSVVAGLDRLPITAGARCPVTSIVHELNR